MHRTLCSWVVTALVAALPGATVAAAEDVFPLADVERGQRGYGLSVFQGTEPARFEFEVIGVWRNVQPDTSYILAEFSGQGLEETGVIAGMSGSPVYIDGRLAGAVAFAWPFSKKPIGGITPIESMRELLEVHRGPGSRASAAGAPIDLPTLVSATTDESRLIESLARLRRQPVGGAQPGVQWLAAGFGERSRRLLSAGLGDLTTAGTGLSQIAPDDLVPGSSVSGVLVDGEFRLAVTGTVTDRTDDRVLAFGHAFLGLGPLSLPMATSEVVAVLSNQLSSFKVANLGRIVGAFDLDHAAGFRGEIGGVAPMLPVTVRLDGRDRRQVELRVAALPELSAALVAISVLGALEVDPEVAGSQSIAMAVRYELGSDGELAMRQSFDGPAAALEMVLHLFAITGFLQQNRLGEVDIESVAVEISSRSEPQLAELLSAHASRTLVRPGESLELAIDLASYRGDVFRRNLTVKLPTDLPPGRFSLLIGDGMNVDAARLAAERVQPVNLRQALDLLASLHSRNQLLVLGVFPGQGLSVSGAVLPRLPDSVRSLWGAAPTADAQPLGLVIAEQEGAELDMPLGGLLRVDLQVEERRPWSGTKPKNGNNGRSD